MTRAEDVLDYCRGNLARGVADAKHDWHWPTLVTATAGRVVVLRKFSAEAGSVRFYTDVRSTKVAELAASGGACAAVFYHGRHRTQLRLSGTASALRDDRARRELFDAQHPRSLRSYATAQAPGTPLPAGGDGLTDTWRADAPTPEELEAAFAHFAVYDVAIERADFLQLGAEGQRRAQWRWGAAAESFTWVTP